MNKDPERMCIACRQHKQKSELWRIVNFNGVILPDLTGKAPGRGAYVCRNGICWNDALRNGKLSKALKGKISAEVEEELQSAWERLNSIDAKAKVLNLIGLGRRAKNIVAGSQGVELAIKRHEAKLVIIAEDAALNSRQDFKRLAETNDIPAYMLGTKEELGKITGQDVRIVIAVIDDDLAVGIKNVIE